MNYRFLSAMMTLGLLTVPGTSLAQEVVGYRNGSNWNTMMGGVSGWSGSWGWIWMIFMWIIMAFVAIAIWRALTHGSNHSSHSRSALDVLKERLAKGEIETKEFEEKKALLEK